MRRRVEPFGSTPEAYNKLLLEFSSSANVVMAEQVFEVMKEKEASEPDKVNQSPCTTII